MSDLSEKLPYNVSGKYYVTYDCIGCDMCSQIAPSCFVKHENGDYSYVFKQPLSQEEFDACEEALESCPVDAIGNDGN